MSNMHRVPVFLLALGALVSLCFAAPAAAQVEQEPLAVPAGPSWDETSGYGAVEEARATIGHASAVPSWHDMSGYGSVEASHATIAYSPAGTPGDDALARVRAERFAQFRAIELFLSRHLGEEVPEP